MILSCSACGTRFLVPDQALVPDGRRVKCGKCGQTWFQQPPPPEAAPAPPPAPPPASAAAPAAASFAAEMGRLEAQTTATVEPPLDPVAAARERVSNLPIIKEDAERRSDRVGWLILAASVVIVIAGAFLARERIVALLPAAAPLYQKIGIQVALPEKLSVQSVVTKQVRENDIIVLEVTGQIANASTWPRPVPKLRLVLLNEKRDEVFEFTFQPTGAEVPAKGSLPFATKLSRPPAEAKSLDVVLVTGEDGEK